MEQYQDSDIFEKRGVKKIKQYSTPFFKAFSREEYNSVRYKKHYWTNGDRYWKLANEYYGDPKLWWVIAWYNQKPNEGMVKPGVVVFVPQPLQKVLTYFNYGTV